MVGRAQFGFADHEIPSSHQIAGIRPGQYEVGSGLLGSGGLCYAATLEFLTRVAGAGGVAADFGGCLGGCGGGCGG